MSRYPYRWRRRCGCLREAAGLVAAGLVLAGLVSHAAHAAPAAARGHGAGGSSPVATQAIAYAERQLGKPYQWGATGPDAFDCSGLALEAYASAGVHLARTSQRQWATETHVTSPQPGDLVFFAGADGTMTSPGHVGIVIGHGQMIEAYGTGDPVRVASYDGRPGLAGFSQPWGGAP